jgi:ABC-type uncharacterized transport system substrate-binding protein
VAICTARTADDACGRPNQWDVSGKIPAADRRLPRGLKESGFVDGENITIEYRWANGDCSRLPALVADLVKRQVAVIVANTPANIAAKKATDTIPVAFTTASDPVQIGLVTNLNHPGGNVTGITQFNASLGPKRLELAHELLPAMTNIALLVNPNDPACAEKFISECMTRRRVSRCNSMSCAPAPRRKIEAALTEFSKLKAGAPVVGADAFYNANAKLLAETALRKKVPTIYEYTQFTDAGGLMSYCGNIKESYRWAGIYTGRTLKGEARRPSSPAVDHGRADREFEDGQESRHHRATLAARSRRQNHRIGVGLWAHRVISLQCGI